MSTILCRLEELTGSGGRGFEITVSSGRLDGFVVRRGGKVHAYVNRCPHTGARLTPLAVAVVEGVVLLLSED